MKKLILLLIFILCNCAIIHNYNEEKKIDLWSIMNKGNYIETSKTKTYFISLWKKDNDVVKVYYIKNVSKKNNLEEVTELDDNVITIMKYTNKKENDYENIKFLETDIVKIKENNLKQTEKEKTFFKYYFENYNNLELAVYLQDNNFHKNTLIGEKDGDFIEIFNSIERNKRYEKCLENDKILRNSDAKTCDDYSKSEVLKNLP
ncbi:MAG: hypothetical protein Ta2D_07370 [Rickettsiales bacterium]|nr:MAG: hypothetical protein Ta2D_07370 [Rickettsiales bacterium]